MGQTHSYLKDGKYFEFDPNTTSWNNLPFNVQWMICQKVPYISIIRWRRVNKRWMAAMDKIIAEYPSGKIFDGLFRYNFIEANEGSGWIPHSLTHGWSFGFMGTQTLVDEVAYMYPRKGKATRESIIQEFLRELRQRFTRQFIKERVTAYNIMFGGKLDYDAPLFGPRIIEVAFVCGPQRDPDEQCFRLHIHNTYVGGNPPPVLGEAYSMRYMHKKYIPEWMHVIEDIVWQGDYAWMGIEPDLDIQRFFTCPAHARSNRLSYLRIMPRHPYANCPGDISYCKHYINWHDPNVDPDSGHHCGCVQKGWTSCEYPEHEAHRRKNGMCFICNCRCAFGCQCYPEYRKCRCDELVEDPWQWQYLDENVGDCLGQHIIELVIYATQRIFNDMGIDWKDFSCRKMDVQKLKKAYEDKFQVELSNDQLVNTDGFSK